MAFVIGLIVGVVGGSISVFIFLKKRPVGVLRIDTSDPDDNPYLFLELTDSIDKVYQSKYVTLKVNTQSYIPHK